MARTALSAPAALRGQLTALALHAFARLPAPVRRGLVRAGTPSYTVGAVCALEHEGRVLVLRQPHRSGWSLPGGLLDRGEGPREGVAREVREETGLLVEVGQPVATQVNAHYRRVDVIYRVVVDVPPLVRPGGEAREARWMAPAEVAADADGPTREILAVLERAERPGGRDGHLL